MTESCCYISDDGVGCDNPATWEAFGESGRPDDFTCACDNHIGMVIESRPHRIVPVATMPVGESHG